MPEKHRPATEAQKAAKRQRAAARKAAGECVQCGVKPAAVKSTRCERCKTAVRVGVARIRQADAAKKQPGECSQFRCQNPAAPGRRNCAACAKKYNVYQRNYRRKKTQPKE